VGAKTEHALRASELVARRVREARQSRGWSQAQLAQRLDEIGYPMARSTLTKLENGRYRNISINDAFALAAALAIAPVFLLAPLADGTPVSITPRLTVSAAHARAWFRGQVTLPAVPDLPPDYSQMPKAELVARLEAIIARDFKSPIDAALKKDLITDLATRWADQLRNPPTNEG
jgi:transcriptional regulator with XRE-family HTH domain